DLSQVEAGIHFHEPLILDNTVNGRVAGPRGHQSDRACPHGVYRVAGKERYVTLSVETEAQWRGLLAVAPLAAFRRPEMAGLEARQARTADLDAALAAWTAGQDGWALADQLRSAGVPASVVLRPSDLYQDVQLTHRGFFVTADHAVMGPTPYDGHPT